MTSSPEHQHHDHPHADGLPGGRGALVSELMHHLPFSVSAVAIGLAVAGIICFVTPAAQLAPAEGAVSQAADCGHDHDHDQTATASDAAGDAHDHDHAGHANPYLSLFHLFHPMHMLFSAAATTAMFWRYERRILKAIVTGLVGAIGICGLSDIVMPQVSMWFMGRWLPWHICILVHPEMVLSFAAVGILLGLLASPGVRRSTFFSHSLHVFSSTMASVFYLIGPFGRLGWIESIGPLFLFVIVAVMIPCCVSDIVFPLLLVGRGKGKYQEEHTRCCG